MRRLENWLGTYLEFSSYSEAPQKFHFWTGVATLAGAVRRKVWIDQGYFQWTPNFYVVFVAPPGIISKSTTANIGMRLLRQIQGIHFGPDAVTWQSLVQSLGNSTDAFELDGTYYPMSAITISSSEFGTFLNPNDREMVDVLVSLWDGQIGIFEKATKTQGNDRIENPWINIIACTTPSWIAGNFPEYMIGGGFTSRTVFVYGENKRHLVPYPKNIIPENFETLEKELVHDLEHIATQIAGEFILSPAAIKWGEEWYENHYNSVPLHLDNHRFGGYLARKQTHIHKLAMILALSQSDRLILEPIHLQAAADEMEILEKDMTLVFQNIGVSEVSLLIQEVMNHIINVKSISLTELYKHFMKRMTSADFEVVLASILRTGEFIQRQTGNDLMISLKSEKRQ